MALSRFKAQNHPQQVSRRWPDDVDGVDDRATHPLHFAEFEEEFGPFTVDVAAAAHNTKCERFYDRETNGLEQPWADEGVWCNPPYSDIAPWIRKAWAEITSKTPPRSLRCFCPRTGPSSSGGSSWLSRTAIARARRCRPDSCQVGCGSSSRVRPRSVRTSDRRSGACSWSGARA